MSETEHPDERPPEEAPESTPDDERAGERPEGEGEAGATRAGSPSEADSGQPMADELEEPEPEAAAEEPEAAEPAPTAEEPEEVEPVAREKPEIPGADLEPDIVPEGVRPEIPGADLEPDLMPEGEEFLDAEAQAAAEAEAEAAAAREEEPEVDARPIAHAAIDLAAGARYTATGKRKTAVARVILRPGSGTYLINGKELDTAFPRETLRRMIRQPLETVGYDARMDVVARMHGGGVSAQAGALRHGISRALIEADPHLRGELKRRGFLTRDPRVKERKKAGLKKARKRPQFSKR
jgi:small subunit ribosomal protein S9